MSPSIYYVRESWGSGTNLQLYALRKAWRTWEELGQRRNDLIESRIRERCVIVVDLLGLSISQLLGQNAPHESVKVEAPRRLLSGLLRRVGCHEGRREDLETGFAEFMSFYDDIRHFGQPKHENLDRLDFATTAAFVDLSIEIWDLIIGSSRQEGHHVDFESIREILTDEHAEEAEIDGDPGRTTES